MKKQFSLTTTTTRCQLSTNFHHCPFCCCCCPSSLSSAEVVKRVKRKWKMLQMHGLHAWFWIKIISPPKSATSILAVEFVPENPNLLNINICSIRFIIKRVIPNMQNYNNFVRSISNFVRSSPLHTLHHVVLCWVLFFPVFIRTITPFPRI